MNIYMAAVHSNGYKHTNRYEKLNDREKYLIDNHVPYLLESYHYIKGQQYVDAIRDKNDKVFLDSGAFSAHSLGVDVNIREYCEYIERNSDIIKTEDGVLLASVLDCIDDPLGTWRNQKIMEDYFHITPLPCFHCGEDERYLEWYVQKYEYITLGGMVGSSVKQLIQWLDRIWGKYLIDGSGKPKLKVHGFGITSVKVMERYPWTSCDSSSWIQSASFGTIITPEYGTIQVSEKSPARQYIWQHAFTLSENEKAVLYQNLLDRGFNIERLSKVYESRAIYNLYAFNEINKIINAKNITTYDAIYQELY